MAFSTRLEAYHIQSVDARVLYLLGAKPTGRPESQMPLAQKSLPLDCVFNTQSPRFGPIYSVSDISFILYAFLISLQASFSLIPSNCGAMGPTRGHTFRVRYGIPLHPSALPSALNYHACMFFVYGSHFRATLEVSMCNRMSVFLTTAAARLSSDAKVWLFPF